MLFKNASEQIEGIHLTCMKYTLDSPYLQQLPSKGKNKFSVYKIVKAFKTK